MSVFFSCISAAANSFFFSSFRGCFVVLIFFLRCAIFVCFSRDSAAFVRIPPPRRPTTPKRGIPALKANRQTTGRKSQVAHCRSKKRLAFLPNPRSLVGVLVLFLVEKYRTEEGRKKTHVSSVFGRWCEIGDIAVFCHFINTIPGLLIDRGLRYRTSRGTRSIID